jgi:hypothetical protein
MGATTSQLSVKWTKGGEELTAHLDFVGERPGTTPGWLKFMYALKNDMVDRIDVVLFDLVPHNDSINYVPSTQRMMELVRMITVYAPSRRPVDVSRLEFINNVMMTAESKARVNELKTTLIRIITLADNPRRASSRRSARDENASTKSESDTETELMFDDAMMNAGVVGEPDISREFAEKASIKERQGPGVGLKTIQKVARGDKYNTTQLYPLACDGVVVVFRPHTGLSEWTNSKQKDDSLRTAIASLSQSEDKYKVGVVLNIDDADYAKDPLVIDKFLDALERFVQDKHLKLPAVMNVFTPSFDLGKYLSSPLRPRNIYLVVNYGEALYPIIE